MPSIEWIRLNPNIFDNEKIQLIAAMPAGGSMLVIWFKLLAQAGITSISGHLIMSDRFAYTEENLATLLRCNVSDVRQDLNTFQKLGMIELQSTGFQGGC